MVFVLSEGVSTVLLTSMSSTFGASPASSFSGNLLACSFPSSPSASPPPILSFPNASTNSLPASSSSSPSSSSSHFISISAALSLFLFARLFSFFACALLLPAPAPAPAAREGKSSGVNVDAARPYGSFLSFFRPFDPGTILRVASICA